MSNRVDVIEAASAGAKAPGTREFLRRGAKTLFINGEWRPSRTGKTFDAENPAKALTLLAISDGDGSDVDDAVSAARKAFEGGWPATTPQQRSRLLFRFAELLEKHEDELAELMTLETGKLIGDAYTEARFTVESFLYYAGWPTKVYGETAATGPDRLAYTLREPVGVCGLIVPWNAPLGIAANKVGPALACGNTLVLKPAEQSSLSSVRMVELMAEAGFPPGVVNLVTGKGPPTGAALAAHPGVDKVSFTGSTAVGKQILGASVGNLKRVSLELGGKSPAVIFADANLAAAVPSSVFGIFWHQGEFCIAASRMFIQQEIYDQFVEQFLIAAKRIKLGDPFDPGTTMGPLVSRSHRDRVLDYVRSGRADGADLRLGGVAVEGSRGYFFEPTVFTSVGNDMKIAREEIFGPVASLIPFKDEDDAVFRGNDTAYGLAASVWTNDISRAHRVARRLDAGTVWINTYLMLEDSMPFAGFKQSGVGGERGLLAIEAYTRRKSIFVHLSPEHSPRRGPTS